MTVVSNTKLFNVRNVTDYYSPIRDIANNQFYVFAARVQPWANTVAEPILDSVQETDYTIFEEMIFGKLVTSSDVKQMIDRNDWTSGTVYDQYDDADETLFTKEFFVVSLENSNYHVFKCLDNNSGAESTSQPKFSETSALDEYYITADGYKWKYMFSIDGASWTKFSTPQYIPVIANTTVEEYASNGAIDTIVVSFGGNGYVSYANGFFTGVAISGNSLTHAIDTGSANNDFFIGSAIYISSGTGAGQVREIVDYSVSGNQYLVSVSSVFSPQPDFTSAYNISPNVKILGDGSGALAISNVNRTTKTVESITVINVGSNYTYANVTVVGNTGTLIANSATARAIISPRGGHGANVVSELNGNKLGISVNFANTESDRISSNNDFSRIGILRNPLYSNVEVTYANATLAFTTGEEVIQYVGVNTAVNVVAANLETYIYNVGNYVALTVANVTPFAVNDYIYQTSSNTTSGVVISTAANTLIVRKDSGTFDILSNVIKNGNTAANTSVSVVSQGLSNTLYGLDSSNTLFSFEANTTVDVSINGSKIFNHAILGSAINIESFSVNSTAVLLYNKQLANSDIITINKYSQVTIYSNSQYTASGTVVSSNTTVLKLTNTRGIFIANARISGLSSGSVANVSSVDGPSLVFSQTLRLTGSYDPGSDPFELDDYCEQGTPGDGGAYGYIQDITDYANGTLEFYITNIKGDFTVGGGYYIQSADEAKKVNVTAKKDPDLVKYTGDLIYVENIDSVSRSNTTTETVKIVLNYY